MLPVNYNDLSLSGDAQLRLNAFNEKYCRNDNGSGDHLGHLILACQMAFPMVLTPKMSNLLWLNFGHYPNIYGTKRIENIAVSDILFSSLCRPLLGNQFEVVPEIRTYLLFLLHDGKWLSEHNILMFGKNRLESIASFLLAYLADKRISKENNDAGFRDLNRYAALAYLSPELLSVNLAESLQATFANTGGEELETEQLRLNLVIKRFQEQISLKLNHKNKIYKNLDPLIKFSLANKERLFDGPAKVVSDLYYSIGKQYIGEMQADNGIQLPVRSIDSKRLLRRKNEVQRIFTIFVSVNYIEQNIGNYFDPKIQIWEGFKHIFERRKDFELIESFMLINQEATFDTFLSGLLDACERIHPEDVLLIYYHGTEALDREDSIAFADAKGLVERIKRKDFIYATNKILKAGNVSSVLILDFPIKDISAYKDAAKFVLSATNIDPMPFERQYHKSGILEHMNSVLGQLGTLPSYSDLMLLLNRSAADQSNGDPLKFQLWTKANKDTVLLDQKIRKKDFSKHFMTFNKGGGFWEVIQEEFIDVLLTRDIQVFEYSGKQVEVSGEIFIRDYSMRVDGDLQNLNQEKVYLVRPRPIALDYVIIYNNSDSDLERIENSLFRRFPDARFNRYGMFNSVTANGYNHDERDNLTERVILEFAVGENNEILVSFEQKKESMPIEESIFATTELKEIREAIRQFSQYAYLSNLNPIGQRLGTASPPPFIFGWLKGQQVNGNDTDNKTLIFDQNSYGIKNGQLNINRLRLEFNESFQGPVYYDLYVLLPNFQVLKLQSGKLNEKTTGSKRIIEIDVTGWADLLIDYKQIIKFKTLFSTEPIVVDFSQKGVSKHLLKPRFNYTEQVETSWGEPFNFNLQARNKFNWGIEAHFMPDLISMLSSGRQNTDEKTERLSLDHFKNLLALISENNLEHGDINGSIRTLLQKSSTHRPNKRHLDLEIQQALFDYINRRPEGIPSYLTLDGIWGPVSERALEQFTYQFHIVGAENRDYLLLQKIQAVLSRLITIETVETSKPAYAQRLEYFTFNNGLPQLYFAEDDEHLKVYDAIDHRRRAVFNRTVPVKYLKDFCRWYYLLKMGSKLFLDSIPIYFSVTGAGPQVHQETESLNSLYFIEPDTELVCNYREVSIDIDMANFDFPVFQLGVFFSSRCLPKIIVGEKYRRENSHQDFIRYNAGDFYNNQDQHSFEQQVVRFETKADFFKIFILRSQEYFLNLMDAPHDEVLNQLCHLPNADIIAVRTVGLDISRERKDFQVIKPYNQQRILVAGTGGRQLSPIEERMARAIGQQLALEGYGVIGGGWPGVDDIVKDAFLKVFIENGDIDEERHITLIESGQKRTGPTDRTDMLQPNQSWYYEATQRAAAVILIGGNGGTYQTYDAAREKGLTVLPVRDTGGDAEKIYFTMQKEGLLLGAGPLGQLIPDDTAAEEISKRIIELIEQSTTPARQ
ncbi:hypothetical protein [Pedobacter miscanthi]|uniref:hypothetical protein n=1 Tax=Pedobacter miscanthi TaxID=2259170 RepID=UPI00292F6AEA|nr:hypothetical protein [Pedobacter miscanthi]